MPLPADFPPQPKRPLASQRLINEDGTTNKSWLDYFDALDRWNAKVRAYLDTL